MIGGWELLLVFFIILLLFGGKRLPDLAKSLGRALAEFKEASAGVHEVSKSEKIDVSDKKST